MSKNYTEQSLPEILFGEYLIGNVISIGLMLIAGAIFAFNFACIKDHLFAPYRLDEEAKLVEITEGETEKWDYIDENDKYDNFQHRATYSYKESLYVYHYVYYVNDIPQTYTHSNSSGTWHKIGDTETVYFYSADGKDYKRIDSPSLFYIFLFISGVVLLIGFVYFVCNQVYKISHAKKKKRKKR